MFRFLYCDDVMLRCAHEMLEFLHGAPYAVCVEEFLSLCVLFWRYFVCFVCGSVRVWGDVGGGRAERKFCVMGVICGESRDV